MERAESALSPLFFFSSVPLPLLALPIPMPPQTCPPHAPSGAWPTPGGRTQLRRGAKPERLGGRGGGAREVSGWGRREGERLTRTVSVVLAPGATDLATPGPALSPRALRPPPSLAACLIRAGLPGGEVARVGRAGWGRAGRSAERIPGRSGMQAACKRLFFSLLLGHHPLSPRRPRPRPQPAARPTHAERAGSSPAEQTQPFWKSGRG